MNNEHPIQTTQQFTEWANTLDSTGTDSTEARDRIRHHAMLFGWVIKLSGQIIEASEKMDEVKKHIFYGKLMESFPYHKYDSDCDKLDKTLGDHDKLRIFHAICGKITEAGELLKAFMTHVIEGGPLDYQNIAEEVGDSLWYDALFAKALGYDSFDPFMQGNYNKLVARYGKEFSAEKALNRDTNKEMEELDKAIPELNFNGYKHLEGIVTQLLTCEYYEKHGHELKNSRALHSLIAMMEGKIPVKLKSDNGVDKWGADL